MNVLHVLCFRANNYDPVTGGRAKNSTGKKARSMGARKGLRFRSAVTPFPLDSLHCNPINQHTAVEDIGHHSQ
jgi:hypothetical protein